MNIMESEIFEAINEDSIEMDYGDNFLGEVLKNILSVLEVKIGGFVPASNIDLLEEVYSHTAEPNNPVREKITYHKFSDKYKGTMDQKFDGQEYLDDKIEYWWKTIEELKVSDIEKIIEYIISEI